MSVRARASARPQCSSGGDTRGDPAPLSNRWASPPPGRLPAASAGLGHAARIITRERLQHAIRGGAVEQVQRFGCNHELKSRWLHLLAIPAVVMTATMISPSMAVVRENEIGTLKQMIVTRVRSWRLVAAKSFPPAVLRLADPLLIYAVGDLPVG